MEEKIWCYCTVPGFILTGDERGHVSTIIALLPYLTADVTQIRRLGKHTSSLLYGVLREISMFYNVIFVNVHDN